MDVEKERYHLLMFWLIGKLFCLFVFFLDLFLLRKKHWPFNKIQYLGQKHTHCISCCQMNTVKKIALVAPAKKQIYLNAVIVEIQTWKGVAYQRITLSCLSIQRGWHLHSALLQGQSFQVHSCPTSTFLSVYISSRWHWTLPRENKNVAVMAWINNVLWSF